MNLKALLSFFPPGLLRRTVAGCSLGRAAGLAALTGAVVLAVAPAASAAGPALSTFAALPLSFEPAPQSGVPGSFLARGLNYQFLISPAEAQLVLCKAARPGVASPLDRAPVPGDRLDSRRAVRISFVGANPEAPTAGGHLLPGKVNYLLGDDASRWQLGNPLFAQVRVHELYPGIDLVYYGNQQRLEYDFNLAPGVDPAVIALHFEGVDRLSVNAEGDLVLGLGPDEIRQPRPTVYQVANGVRQPVTGGYRLQDDHTVRFEPGAYDHTLPLTIDPTLTYSSYFGGNSDDIAWSVKVYTNDQSIYLAGQTLSSQFPFFRTNNFGGLTNHGGRYNGDGFVARLDATGTNVIFFTYLGGEQDDAVLDLAIDQQGNAYITGYTSSTNFPVVPRTTGISGLPASTNIGGTITPSGFHFSDAFVAELSSDGASLIFSGYLGGSDRDSGIGICLDSSNYVYVTGYTYSMNFPTKNALSVVRPGTIKPFLGSGLSGSNDVFVTKLAPRGAGVVYSTYLGGLDFDVGQGIAADQAGNAYVTGYTCSTNFPVTSALAPLAGQLNDTSFAVTKYHGVRVPYYDAFVSKIAPQGSNLIYSVFLGGTNNDSGFRIRTDPSGGVYVCGSTYSPEFPLVPDAISNLYTPALTNVYYINSDAFLTKIIESNNIPVIKYSVHFGGTGDNVAWDLAINPYTTNIFVVGSTLSTNFSTFLPSETNAPFLALTNLTRSNDVFVAAFAPASYVSTNVSQVLSNHTIVKTIYTAVTNSVLTNLYAVCLGGSRDEFGFGVDVDPANNAYIVGQTVSVDFSTLNPLQPGLAGTSDAFLAKLQTTDSVASILVDTTPPNLQVIVDGNVYTAPFATNWIFGSIHSIFTPAIQTNALGSRAVWYSWSNGGAISNLVVPVASNLTYVARFSRQYMLSLGAVGGGMVNPSSGWFDAGAAVSVSATPAAGASFSAWTASGSGSSIVGNPAAVVMNGAISQTAHFIDTLSNRIVVVTQGPGTVSPTYAGQTLVAGRRYTITATPLPNGVFSGWTGSLPSSDQSLSFVMTTGLVFQANFSTNGYLSTQGVYNGLFADPFNPDAQSSGSFSATVSSSGSFSASFRVAGTGYSCSGSFTNGVYSKIVSRSSPLLPLQVNLTLDPSGVGHLIGYLSGYTWTVPIQAERAAYSNSSPAPQAGQKFTLRIPGTTNSLVEPGGDGFITLSVNVAGQVSVVGILSDDTSFSQTASLSALQRWPLYSSLYSGNGFVMGWLSFTNVPGSQPSGQLVWSMPNTPDAKYYPSGFTLLPQAVGSPYALTNGQSVLSLNHGHFVVEGGGLAHNITNAFSLAGSSFTPVPTTNRLSLSVNSSTGRFQGSFYDPASLRTYNFWGALLQSQTNGSGYFVNTNQTGRVRLTP